MSSVTKPTVAESLQSDAFDLESMETNTTATENEAFGFDIDATPVTPSTSNVSNVPTIASVMTDARNIKEHRTLCVRW